MIILTFTTRKFTLRQLTPNFVLLDPRGPCGTPFPFLLFSYPPILFRVCDPSLSVIFDLKYTLEIEKYVYLTSVITAVDQFPSSPTIITLSADIIASADPTCSDDEKTSLTAQATAIDEAIATVEAALEAVQDDLTTATGQSCNEDSDT